MSLSKIVCAFYPTPYQPKMLLTFDLCFSVATAFFSSLTSLRFLSISALSAALNSFYLPIDFACCLCGSPVAGRSLGCVTDLCLLISSFRLTGTCSSTSIVLVCAYGVFFSWKRTLFISDSSRRRLTRCRWGITGLLMVIALLFLVIATISSCR